MPPSQPVTFLLVEDDMLDIKAIQRAFHALHIVDPLVLAHDGVEALEMLHGTNGHEQLSKPYVIVLDLNMPRMNGLEFLQALRNDQQLRDAVVFVLTTSSAAQDITAAYQWNVAGYIVKSSANDAVAMLHHHRRVVEFS